MNIERLFKDNELYNYTNYTLKHLYNKFGLIRFIEFEDYKQDCYLVLTKSLKNFDEKRCKPTTFIFLVLRTQSMKIIEYVERSNVKINYEKIDSVRHSEEGDYNLIDEVASDIIIDNIIIESELLKDWLSNFDTNSNEYKLIKLIYEGYKRKDISKILNIKSYEYDNIKNRIRKKLKGKL